MDDDFEDFKWGFADHLLFWAIMIMCGFFMLVGVATTARWLLMLTTS